jgi:hypothetical protein
MTVRATQPEILPPGTAAGERGQRMGGAGGVFRNEHLDMLSKVLDTWFRVPGTPIRFGLDGIVGFIPGIGDFLGGLASCVIVLAAFFRGVAMITIARMVANLAIEVGVGLIPVVGNFFDIAWRANRRNYHLLERSLQGPARDTATDWVFMGLLGLGLLTMAMVPFLLLLWLGGSILHALGASGWR